MGLMRANEQKKGRRHGLCLESGPKAHETPSFFFTTDFSNLPNLPRKVGKVAEVQRDSQRVA